MTRPKGAQPELIKTTRTVATLLSSGFGIRSGYEIVDGSTRFHLRPTSITPSEMKADGSAVAVLAAFFAQQDEGNLSTSIRRITGSASRLESIKIGDVVEVNFGSSTLLTLVHAVTGKTVCGTRLFLSIDTILYDMMAANEVFASTESITTNRSSIVARIDPNSIKLRYAWDQKRPAFIGLNEWSEHTISNDDDIIYHEGDFVLLEPPHSKGHLLDIVQIHRIRERQVLVRFLRRQTSQSAAFRDERLLEPSKELTSIEKVYFQPIATIHVSLPFTSVSWTSERFYVSEADFPLLSPRCEICTTSQGDKRKIRRSLDNLRCMELMCGAGGLSIGLGLSGTCETKFAIDSDLDSTKTFKGHHPDAKVYYCDAGDALYRAVSDQRLATGSPLPCHGDVDVIVAGPPCQGFSRKNKKASREAANDDPRNLLVCTVLGWVEFLQPKYFILENVEGFTLSKLGGREQGMVKLVIMCLLELGYATTFGFVQSGEFGCPQSRGRFVLLAARADLTLPTLPKPKHHFLGKHATPLTWTDGQGKLYAAERPGSGTALLPAVTVRDAIGDLPVFDWKDPHQVYAGPDQIELDRQQQGIPQLEVIPGQATGFAKAHYNTNPTNSFQERMRVIASQTMRALSQHQTSGLGAMEVERVVNVALRPGADYDSWSWPDVNKGALLGGLQLNRWEDAHYRYERIDGDKYFKALMTKAPAQGSMIHPTQRRLFTVRECARAQGFPDWVEFCTDDNLKSAYRQIGNAVPVPLAVALGESLIAARLKDAERNQQQRSGSKVIIIVD